MYRQKVSRQQAALMVLLGVVTGILLGFAVMGTAKAMYGTDISPQRQLVTQQQQQFANTMSTASSSSSQQSSTILLSTATSTKTAATTNSATSTMSTINAATIVNAATSSAPPARSVTQMAGKGEISSYGKSIHTLITSNGSPYQNFQTRIMYGTYKLVQKMSGGEFLTGFTRIMHRQTPDILMDEVPTFLAKPLHPECDIWCDFPVADRPNAVWQWAEAAKKQPSMVQGDWVLLAECDYVWMKPLQAPDARDVNAPGLQFLFDYIMPQHPNCIHIIRRLVGRENVQDVPASGPAPALIRFDDLYKVIPDWEKVTAAIEADEEAKKVLGWVREMYAWDIAIAKQNVKMTTQNTPDSPLIFQPPHDRTIGAATMAHYTWGALYHLPNGTMFYKWEKREYTDPKHALKVPLLPMPPEEFHDGWKLQDGLAVTRELHETLRAMIGQMNKAIVTLPDLTNASV